jgi:hypothetical protein
MDVCVDQAGQQCASSAIDDCGASGHGEISAADSRDPSVLNQYASMFAHSLAVEHSHVPHDSRGLRGGWK